MINSMTGYACQEKKTEHGNFIWEIKSVNQRYLETFFKLPDNMRYLEGELREYLRHNLERGKVECSLKFMACINAENVSINEDLAKFLVSSSEKIISFAKTSTSVSFNPMDILLYPGVIDNNNDNKDILSSEAIACFKEAVAQLKEARQREGEKLQLVLHDKLNKVNSEVSKVREKIPVVLNWQKEKLLTTFKELSVELDPSRLEQEMIIVAQKIDVAEELDRLNAHVSETFSILKKGGSCGRRLDFMMQEFNRESNTLASKSINTEITNSAIELKVLIEQMREQIQNIE